MVYNPKETSLKYKNQGNGIISLLVDPVSNAEYVWQMCKAKTAIWENVKVTNNNTITITINPITNKGDKYRCLIRSNKKIIFYSKVLTVGSNKYQDQEKSRHYYQQQSQYKQPTPSVSDTDNMDGFEFEHYCAQVLRRNGFNDVKVTQGSGDYGIDILAKKDSITYAIQCKCYSSPVGNKAVQEAFSGKSFYHCMVAVVLTNSYFTDAAKETAKRNAVVLWDRNYLDRMIKNTESSERERQRQWQEQQRREQERQQHNNRPNDSSMGTMPDFFKGCSTWEQVRDRYRKLMQMYHPDYESGDEEYTKAINAQYEELKRKYNQ